MTRAIVRAQEHWHQEAKEILATKEDLHTQTWRFFGLLGLMVTIVLGAMYYMTNDLKNDLKGEMRELRVTINAIPK